MRGTAVKLGWRIWGQGFQEKWRERVVKRGRVQHFYIFRNCILWKNFVEVNFTKVFYNSFFNALFCPKVYFLYTSICLKCIFFPGEFLKNAFLDAIASYSSGSVGHNFIFAIHSGLLFWQFEQFSCLVSIHSGTCLDSSCNSGLACNSAVWYQYTGLLAYSSSSFSNFSNSAVCNSAMFYRIYRALWACLKV